MGAHAKLSASGSSMWLNCTGSRRMNEGKPDSTSVFAVEGTLAHALAEYCLRENLVDVSELVGIDLVKVSGDKKLGEQLAEFEISPVIEQEMADYVQEYVDYVNSFAEGADMVLIETRVDYSPWVEDGFGTADAIIVSGDAVNIIDLKYGKGVAVSAYENTQGMMYGLGVLYLLNQKGVKVEHFNIHIHQPRLQNVSEYHVTKGQLLHWGEKTVRPAAIEAMSDTAPLTAGEKQCTWCKAKGNCTEYARFSLEKSVEGFTFDSPIVENMPIKSDTLTLEEYSILLPQLKSISDWTKAVEAEAMKMMESGQLIPGYKLVEGRSNRRWVDETTAVHKLTTKLTETEMYSRKLISPTQAEKLLGKNDPLLKDIVEKPEGKPTLAHESDKRPAIGASRTAGFTFEQQP